MSGKLVQRYYLPGTGRFATADGSGLNESPEDPNSWNQYAYVQGDPINANDPTGEFFNLLVNLFKVVNPVNWFGFGSTPPRPPGPIPPSGIGRPGPPGFFQPPAPSPPPRPTPKVATGSGSGRQREILDGAYTEARQRLTENEECAKLFGGDAGLKTFDNTEYRFVPIGNTRVGAQIASHAPAQVFINSRGPMFSPVQYNGQTRRTETLDFGTGLTGADLNALFLLHELGHLVGIFGADSDDPGLNRSYTQQVLDKCFKRLANGRYQ
ncbi:MAG: hypothetical protein H7Y20_02820 [Bryobacteraceae bacterium]|nr:hypothetical protein [Bryobacteraceae bacterium]